MPAESFMMALDELRAIHSQRIADERATFEAERQAVLEHRRRIEAEQAAASAASLREERDAQLRIEETRLAAEREARLKLEAMDASERTRHAAELDAQRQVQELDLRRAEVAKQRPRWMMVVTTLAVAAGIALGYVAIQSSRDADAAVHKRDVAEAQKLQARRDAAAAEQQLAMMEKDLDIVHTKLEKAVEALAVTDKEADRIRARQAVAAAQAEEAAQRKRLEDWRIKKEHDIRTGGLHMDNCVGTATGCIPH